MPRFHSATEGDALKWIREHLRLPTDDAPRFEEGQVHAVLNVIDGYLPLFKGTRNSITPDPPLFIRPSPLSSTPPVVRPLPQPEFRISYYEQYEHQKEIQKQRQLEELVATSSVLSPGVAQEQTCNTRPSSDFSSSTNTLREGSPKASSVVTPTFLGDGDIDKDVSMPSPINNVHSSGLHDHNSEDDDFDVDPDLALRLMHTEFSRWSHNKREGVDAVTGVVMRAPTDTHVAMLYNDRETWSESSRVSRQNIKVDEHELQDAGDPTGAMCAQDSTHETLSFDSLHRSSSSRVSTDTVAHRDTASVKDDSADKDDMPQEQSYPSLRAAIIAKGKANSNSSILTAQPGSQKRSAHLKKKNRKPTMPPLPETRPETAQQLEQQQQEAERKPKFLIFDNTDAGRRIAITHALKAGLINPDNPSDVAGLLKKMKEFKPAKRAKTEDDQDAEEPADKLDAVLTDIKEATMRQGAAETEADAEKIEGEEVVKSQRAKGKARKNAKKNATT